MFSTRSGRSTLSMISLLGSDEELVARIASRAATRSSSPNSSVFTSTCSGADSMTSHAPSTAPGRSPATSTRPVRSGRRSSARCTSATCCSTWARPAWSCSADGSKSRTSLPPATKTVAMRRPSVPAPAIVTGRRSTSSGSEYAIATPVLRRGASGGGLVVGQLPARSREVAGVAVGVALEVVLVLGLGLPERDGVADLGDHLAGPQARRIDVGDRVLGDLALLVARHEDLRAVAGADVVALAVLGRRVVDLEEELQDVAVGDALGVEDDLDRLGVAGMAPVRGVLVLPTGVSDPGGDDSVAMAQQLLDAPEAAAGEDGGLGCVVHGVVFPPKFRSGPAGIVHPSEAELMMILFELVHAPVRGGAAARRVRTAVPSALHGTEAKRQGQD